MAFAKPALAVTRRQTIRGLCIGSLGLLAGCLAASGSRNAESTTAFSDGPPAKPVDVERIAADPTAIPEPITRTEPTEVEVELEVIEVVAEIEPGVTLTYMTYGGQVPGPMIRVRRGDTVTLTLRNRTDSRSFHNVDFHAVYGPGGGADATQIGPGESATIRFKAMYPGAFMYHCAVPDLDHHISRGMYGLILVEPENGLPEVDREFYLGQHEIYTNRRRGADGHHEFDYAAMAAEDPTYVVINGAVNALTEGRNGPIEATVGETARVFFVSGGPNLTSNFHPIGNVWTELWAEGALSSDPERYVQTKPVAPGSCLVATMDFPVPGDVRLVDHALSRVKSKGCLAVISVAGPEDTEIYDPSP